MPSTSGVYTWPNFLPGEGIHWALGPVRLGYTLGVMTCTVGVYTGRYDLYGWGIHWAL